MADLVDGCCLALAHEQPIRTVDDEAWLRTDAPVAVHHPFGDDGRPRVVDAHGHFHAVPVGGTIRAVIPKGQLEVAGTDPAEEVRLVHVLVRPPQYARVRHAHIAHLGPE